MPNPTFDGTPIKTLNGVGPRGENAFVYSAPDVLYQEVNKFSPLGFTVGFYVLPVPYEADQGGSKDDGINNSSSVEEPDIGNDPRNAETEFQIEFTSDGVTYEKPARTVDSESGQFAWFQEFLDVQTLDSVALRATAESDSNSADNFYILASVVNRGEAIEYEEGGTDLQEFQDISQNLFDLPSNDAFFIVPPGVLTSTGSFEFDEDSFYRFPSRNGWGLSIQLPKSGVSNGKKRIFGSEHPADKNLPASEDPRRFDLYWDPNTEEYEFTATFETLDRSSELRTRSVSVPALSPGDLTSPGAPDDSYDNLWHNVVLNVGFENMSLTCQSVSALDESKVFSVLSAERDISDLRSTGSLFAPLSLEVEGARLRSIEAHGGLNDQEIQAVLSRLVENSIEYVAPYEVWDLRTQGRSIPTKINGSQPIRHTYLEENLDNSGSYPTIDVEISDPQPYGSDLNGERPYNFHVKGGGVFASEEDAAIPESLESVGRIGTEVFFNSELEEEGPFDIGFNFRGTGPDEGRAFLGPHNGLFQYLRDIGKTDSDGKLQKEKPWTASVSPANSFAGQFKVNWGDGVESLYRSNSLRARDVEQIKEPGIPRGKRWLSSDSFVMTRCWHTFGPITWLAKIKTGTGGGWAENIFGRLENGWKITASQIRALGENGTFGNPSDEARIDLKDDGTEFFEEDTEYWIGVTVDIQRSEILLYAGEESVSEEPIATLKYAVDIDPVPGSLDRLKKGDVDLLPFRGELHDLSLYNRRLSGRRVQFAIERQQEAIDDRDELYDAFGDDIFTSKWNINNNYTNQGAGFILRNYDAYANQNYVRLPIASGASGSYTVSVDWGDGSPIGTFSGNTTFIKEGVTNTKLVALQDINVGSGYSIQIDWGDGTTETFDTTDDGPDDSSPEIPTEFENDSGTTVTLAGGIIVHEYEDLTGEYDVTVTGVDGSLEFHSYSSIDNQSDVDNSTPDENFSGGNAPVEHFYGERSGEIVIEVFREFGLSNRFDNSDASRWKLISISNWGGSEIYAKNSFHGNSFLKHTASDAPNITTADLSSSFMSANSLGVQGNMNNWDVSGVDNMRRLFRNSASFNQPIGKWDTSNVTGTNGSFFEMFWGAAAFNQNINTKLVSAADSPTGTEYVAWNTSNAMNIRSMFRDATTFNQPIGKWNTSNVTNGRGMDSVFRGAAAFNQNINTKYDITVGDLTYDAWDVSAARNMERMFQGCASFDQPLGEWVPSSVYDMNRMFLGAASFDQPLGEWDVSTVDDMGYIFASASSFNNGGISYGAGSIGNWNLPSVTDMTNMFANTSFNQPIGRWDTPQLTTTQRMFLQNEAFNNGAAPGGIITGPDAFENWSIPNVAIMASMFKQYGGNSEFNQPVANWNVSSVEYMGGMFRGCTKFNQPLGEWDVRNVESMFEMFENARVFNNGGVSSGVGALNNWVTDSLVSTADMFKGAKDFNQDISNWKMDGVSNLRGMFYAANSFNQDLASWNVSNVTTFDDLDKNISGAFAHNSGLSAGNVDAILNAWEPKIDPSITPARITFPKDLVLDTSPSSGLYKLCNKGITIRTFYTDQCP